MLRRAPENRRATRQAGRGEARRVRGLDLGLTMLMLSLLFALAAPALAVEPDEMLKDPKLEARARSISSGLRCLVCQNQSIDDSNAALAKDLRILVRERLKAGDSDERAVQFIVARYGEFVLLRPRFALHTLILWLATPLFLLLAAFLVWRGYCARVPDSGQARLTEEERKSLEHLLDDDDEEQGATG